MPLSALWLEKQYLLSSKQLLQGLSFHPAILINTYYSYRCRRVWLPCLALIQEHPYKCLIINFSYSTDWLLCALLNPPPALYKPSLTERGWSSVLGKKEGYLFLSFFPQHNKHLIKGIATYWKSEFSLTLSFRFLQFDTQHLQSMSPQLEHCYTPTQAGPLSEICNTAYNSSSI